MKYLIIFFLFLSIFGAFVFGTIIFSGKADDEDAGSIQEAVFVTGMIVCVGCSFVSGLAAIVTAILGMLELFA